MYYRSGEERYICEMKSKHQCPVVSNAVLHTDRCCQKMERTRSREESELSGTSPGGHREVAKT